jgi:replication factor C subunit 2/4
MYLRADPNRDHSAELYTVKHAPKRLLEFKGNQGVVQTLNSFIESNNIPNLIITGSHGTGKSLLVKLLVEEYMKVNGVTGGREEYLGSGLLEIYGSLSRGKDVVTEKQVNKNSKGKNFNCTNITDFMKRTTNLPKGILKIVAIYEFHQMSTEAQMALRRVMELNAHRVRFIFVTQDYSEIILALQSRCTILKLRGLDREEMEEILMEICKAEEIPVSQELFEVIYLNADGDIRVAVNMLQVLGKCSRMEGEGTESEKMALLLQKYYQILGIPEISTIKEILRACQKGDGRFAHREIHRLIESGYDISDLLDILTRVLICLPEFTNKDGFLRVLCHDTYTIQECYTETQLHNLINHMVGLSIEG